MKNKPQKYVAVLVSAENINDLLLAVTNIPTAEVSAIKDARASWKDIQALRKRELDKLKKEVEDASSFPLITDCKMSKRRDEA